MADSFSQRHALAGPLAGTLLRDEVPPSFRMFLLNLPHDDHLRADFSFDEFQRVICGALQVWPNPAVPPYYDCQKHLKECEWFRIYDIIEGVHRYLNEKANPNSFSRYVYVTRFIESINKAFIAQNIGWQLAGGKIVMRGDEAFEGTVKTAIAALEEDAKPTAAGHLRFAISALSARPKANTSGAVAHATSGVECVLGEITGESMTLGKYLDKNPSLFHPALKKGLDGIYGYASDEGARHGKEGTEPAREDAEFAVAVCAAVCTLLTRKHPNDR